MEIPIEKAMILWNPKNEGGGIKVIRNPERSREFRHLHCSAGACYAYWAGMTTEQRKTKLLIEAWHIAVRDGLDPKEIHEALMVVPEYREMLSGDMPGEEGR